ncbi:MAG: YebC/PmpR family DNA-binding transcriptional regulator [Cytophagia bacterium]|nr:MAG: YebC/PmpR family DNA-binding transcriptional regulator [Cytophagales bacterium]TAG06840.1 MAG: YebC/PmpR family DNA-binding transcriptional regulator [Cytophagia bacterium]TAG43511.1 MAG: YebC/PmpR family DNA-binding transcriptional regulator [Cytophagia bacterium]TAH30249.1 MAG: YebC/PmpR family DNA-binding transcriptional regulator [Cytophagales bacterium]
MSGHSKWSTIKRKKGALDAKRGNLFTKLAKEITVAAKLGLPDMNVNARLRLAVQNARGANMPKENIERAVKKAQGNEGENYSETTYEGYASHGIAVFVECTTDNINRTVANVRSYFTKHGAGLAVSGSVDFLFERKSIFTIKKPTNISVDDFELEMIDAGAENIEIEDEFITITASMEDFGKIQKKLDDLKIEVEEGGLRRIPLTLVDLNDEQFTQVMKLIEKLEDDDDVQKVYHNINATEAQMEM